VPGPYAELLGSGDSPDALLRRIETTDRTVPDQWQAQIQAKIQAQARVLVRADGVPDDDLRAAHVEPVDDVQAAVLDAAGPDGRICVLPEGPQTIPYLA
jgi:lactate racemase